MAGNWETVINDEFPYTCDCADGFDGFDCSRHICNQDAIFQINCLDNFNVKIDVTDAECFNQEYPTLTLKDLVVHASDSNDVTTENTCKAYTGTESGKNLIFSDAALKASVETDSTSLFIDGKVCSTDPVFESTDTALVYKAKLTTYIHDSGVNILFEPAMLAVDFECKYKQTVDGPVVIDSLILDKPEKDSEIKVAEADISSLVITPSISVEQLDGSFSSVTGDVILGSKVKVTFTSSADTLDIHIGSCVAGDAAESPTNSIDLIEADCFLQSNTGALFFIKPTSAGSTCDTFCQTEMTMNQFAFIDPSFTDNENPDLVFHMRCTVELGAADCQQARRRRQAEEFKVIDVSYSINGSHFTVDEGIAHALDSTSSYKHLAPLTAIVMAFILS